ncbi:hypothetical protein [Salmon gill poxvirus]
MNNNYLTKCEYFRDVIFENKKTKNFSLHNWPDELADFYKKLQTNTLINNDIEEAFTDVFKESFINRIDELEFEPSIFPDPVIPNKKTNSVQDLIILDDNIETDFMSFMKEARHTMTECHVTTDFSNNTFIPYELEYELTDDFDDNTETIKKLLTEAVEKYGLTRLGKLVKDPLCNNTVVPPPPPPPPLPPVISQEESDIISLHDQIKKNKQFIKRLNPVQESAQTKINDELKKLFDTSRGAKTTVFSIRHILNGI